MRRPPARTTSKASVKFQHPVPLTLLPEYLDGAVPYFVAVKSVVIEYVALSFDEYDALRKACMEERFPSDKAAGKVPALELRRPRVGLAGGAE